MILYLSLYLGFLFLVSLLYYSIHNKVKHIVLFAASLSFIAYFSWKYAFFAIILSSFNFFVGKLIDKYRRNTGLRLMVFWTGIILNIGILAFIKYFSFLYNGFLALISIFSKVFEGQLFTILLPLGISYYTFQSLGYIIRINRGSEKPESDYINFVTFLIFFPKVFAGPVERSNHFFPQINKLHGFDATQVSDGLRLFLWGAFKKVVIATSLYTPVQQIYANVYSFSGFQLLLVFFVQTIYIYMEFSGYTDMALGSAKVLGINLIDNFNRPFLSRNISEFWRRWHISLSSWCNDFIYSPFIVKYRRYEDYAIITGIFLTFFIIGIWHAANWTFVVLGVLQGVAIVYEFYTKKYRLKWASLYPKSYVNTFSRIIVFLFVCLSMVFFFSPTISDAWYFLSHFLDFNSSSSNLSTILNNKLTFVFALICFLLIFVTEILNEKGKKISAFFLKQPIWVRWVGYAILVTVIYLSDSAFLPFEYMKF